MFIMIRMHDQRCADPQISRPRIIRVRKHQVRVRNCNGDSDPQTVRIRKKGQITLYPIDNA